MLLAVSNRTVGKAVMLLSVGSLRLIGRREFGLSVCQVCFVCR